MDPNTITALRAEGFDQLADAVLRVEEHFTEDEMKAFVKIAQDGLKWLSDRLTERGDFSMASITAVIVLMGAVNHDIVLEYIKDTISRKEG
jgi:hypothetical protein